MAKLSSVRFGLDERNLRGFSRVHTERSAAWFLNGMTELKRDACLAMRSCYYVTKYASVQLRVASKPKNNGSLTCKQTTE